MKYRFLLIQAFHLPEGSPYLHRPVKGPKEQRLMNHDRVAPLLADVEWALHPGPLAPYGDWPVESREEFALVAAGRLPIVREACESGKYNAIVLLGGGEPGFQESREIARPFNIPVTACGWAQMHVASLLGNRFSIIDHAEIHNMYYRDLVVMHGYAGRCGSIRNIDFPLPRPAHRDVPNIQDEKARALRGERSAMLDAAVAAAEAAIEDDGAEVVTFGCSATFWMQPFLQKRLNEIGWEVPVLEGYSCAITLAKAMVDMGLSASGLTYPGDHPRKTRKRKVI